MSIPLMEYDYTLDGNRIAESESIDDELTEYTYDRLGRLLTESEKVLSTEIESERLTYTYDDYSNRATKAVLTGGTTTYTYDANNRLQKESTVEGSVTSVTNYGYDNNGNQITTWEEEEEANGTGTPTARLEVIGEDTEPKATYNVYNGFNQLIKTSIGNTKSEYAYNGDGLRTSKTVNGAETRHIWSGANIIFEISSSDEVQYIRGINLISIDDGTTESFYMFNAHGDVVHLTNSSTGAITKDYTYDAFGIEENQDSADKNPFRYCGEYFDKSSNTYYLRARYYSPNTGRFISEDSYWGNETDPLSLNTYVYCINNPIIYVDFSGYAPWSDISDFKSDWAGRTILLHYLFGKGKDFVKADNHRWNRYMMENETLTLRTRSIIRKLVVEVSNGSAMQVDLITNMEIENGEQIIGYQYLHGTNADVDGFQISGTITKDTDGVATIDLVYTWNDIMDPNPIYTTDEKKADFAEKIPFADPTGYTASISWSDTSVMSNTGEFTEGWLSKDTTVYLEPIPLPAPPKDNLSMSRKELK